MSTSLGPQLFGNQRGKTGLRVPHGFMREHKTPLQKHFGQITQTQFIPQPPQHDEQDNISRIFQKVEWGFLYAR